MGLSLSSGGHLTHGARLTAGSKFFKAIQYEVKPDGYLDYDLIEKLAMEHKPKLICVGASAYSRVFDWKRFRQICDKVGAVFMADIAHYAGLIAAGEYPSPVAHADFVTTTTHKTLRGPRGGVVMCKERFAKDVDRVVFPGSKAGR
jgi:glycine hydroxymethyltransferase